MGRLTKRETEKINGKEVVLCNYKDNDCNDSCWYENCNWNYKALEKLKDYEDAEEQGLLLRLPCKIGSTIYWLRTDNRSIPRILPVEVARYATNEDRPKKRYLEEIKTVYNGFSKRFSVSEFGRTLFLALEEAEKALAEMEECHESIR